jgi:hypothetical protein
MYYRTCVAILEAREGKAQMIAGKVVAYGLGVFLCVIGLVLLIRPEAATGPRGLPLLRGQSRPLMAVLAARELVLGLIAGGLAFTGNLHGLLLCFAVSLLIILIDAIALYKTRSMLGFIVNDLVGFVLLFAVCRLLQALGGF